MFDKDFKTFQRLPKVPSSDYCFFHSDKETIYYNADAKSWAMIIGIHKARKFSSGCFLHGKFYVLGGRDENDKHLTCGESYDETTNSWELIPDMLKDLTFITPSQSPPLIAVVDDNLYMLETSLNELRVYDIKHKYLEETWCCPCERKHYLWLGDCV
uniref:F-box associated domain-containing protein n=1 Tax=Brassica campestris TaxID=3711 RepID=A0A3P5Z166_BRACM|nr:unnamed protein product [Brassica rapa]